MIYVKKSSPPPPCLEEEKKKKSGDYKCGNVVERVKTDFRNKCYICEYKEPSTVNIEHFIPHRGDSDLKFDWNNLFWACGHCNSTKSTKYENILNCTNPNHKVVEWIRYKFPPFPKEEAKFDCLENRDIVRNTIELLEAAYNGTTKIKKIESSNIRQRLLEEILQFHELLEEYCETTKKEKEICLRQIKKHLKANSAFTAFKYWIIIDNPVLKKEFQHYLDYSIISRDFVVGYDNSKNSE